MTFCMISKCFATERGNLLLQSLLNAKHRMSTTKYCVWPECEPRTTHMHDKSSTTEPTPFIQSVLDAKSRMSLIDVTGQWSLAWTWAKLCLGLLPVLAAHLQFGAAFNSLLHLIRYNEQCSPSYYWTTKLLGTNIKVLICLICACMLLIMY